MRLKTGLLAAAAVLTLAVPAAASAQDYWSGTRGYDNGYSTGYGRDYEGGRAYDWREHQQREAYQRWEARRRAYAYRDAYASDNYGWRREHDGYGGWNGYGERGYDYGEHRDHDDER